MKITFEFPEQAALDILTTAFEQGSRYWLNNYLVSLARREDLIVLSLHIEGIHDEKDEESNEPAKHTKIDAERIAAALSHMLVHPDEDGAWAAAGALAQTDADGCGADANACDSILQFAVFGELVYG